MNEALSFIMLNINELETKKEDNKKNFSLLSPDVHSQGCKGALVMFSLPKAINLYQPHSSGLLPSREPYTRPGRDPCEATDATINKKILIAFTTRIFF
jgi:hypothetical protein